MSDSSVADMSETQFSASLDALMAGDLEEAANNRVPFTAEALHQHDSQQQPQQRSTTLADLLHHTGQRPMSQLTMNPMVDGATFPSLVAGQLTGLAVPPSHGMAMPGPIHSSLTSTSVPSSMYATNVTESMQDFKKSRSHRSSKRKKEFDGAAVSEDEGNRLRRKEERNAREQKRSQQIVDQISKLRDLLSSSNVETKPDKYSTLVTAAQYIRQLQERSAFLEGEQKKLLLTLGQAIDVSQNKYIPVTSSSESDNDILDKSVSSKHADISVSDGDDSSSYVQGLDYRSVFMACPVAGAITSIDGRFLDCNEDFEEITGYTKDELFRKPSESTPFESSERHLSVFNVLKREDMERLFVIMSDMLRKPADDAADRQRREMDRWSDQVALNRKANVLVTLNIKLVRRRNGLPKFFSCSLIPFSQASV